MSRLRAVMRWFLGLILRFVGPLLVALLTLLTSSVILIEYLPEDVTFEYMGERLLDLDFSSVQQELARVQTPTRGFLIQSVFVLLAASLVVGLRCARAFAGPSGRQALEALPEMPKKIRPLMRGKLKRRMRPMYLYLLAYAVPAAALAWIGGLMPFLTVLVVLGATWGAMYFIGAVGIWCSVRFHYTIPSFVGVLSVGYGGGALLSAFTVPIAGTIALLVAFGLLIKQSAEGGNPSAKGLFGQEFQDALIPAVCLVLLGAYFLAGRHFLRRTEKLAFRYGR
jgi:hypothetical protein